MRIGRLATGVALGALLGLLLTNGCMYRAEGGPSQDSDADVAFRKTADELDDVERYCLRSAQLFCHGLEPCCGSINYSFDRDICIMVRADHCTAPRGPGSMLIQSGADACLSKLEHQFDACLQPYGEAVMPIDLHSRPVCDGAWAGTVKPVRYAPGEACNEGIKLCEAGTFCDNSVQGDARTCVSVLPEGSACQYTYECETGLYCNDDDTCVPVLNDGETCQYFEHCASALCCDQACVRAPAVDAHLCWIYNFPGGDYPNELGDGLETPCTSIKTNAAGKSGSSGS